MVCSGGVIPEGLRFHQLEGLETVPGGQRVLARLSGSPLCPPPRSSRGMESATRSTLAEMGARG